MSTDPGFIRSEVLKDVQDFTGELAEECFDTLTEKTPVLTGSTRASWNMTTRRPVFTRVKGGSKDNPLPPPRRPSISFAPDEVPIIIITNGWPHLELLEQGSSKQAPNGFINATLDMLSMKY